MSRLISCYTNNFGAWGVRSAVERINACGINHLELALRGHNFGGLVIPEEAVVTEKADEATVRDFIALLHHHEVRISGCNVGGGDLRTKEGIELTEARMRFASARLRATMVITGAGHPTTPEEHRTVIAHLKRLGDLAETLDLVVALETHKGLTQNAAAMQRLMEQVDHTRVRLNFDTGNIAYYNEGADPVAELRQVAPYVRNVHLKDNRGRFEDWFFPALGEGGAVDFAAVRQVLDAARFQGPYTIEIEGIHGEAEPGLEGRTERVRRSVEYLRVVGYL